MPNRTLKHRPKFTILRRKLRRAQTPAEELLWSALRRRQLVYRKFRRQQRIGKYIVDFYCATEKLVIELDGEPHYFLDGTRDNERDEFLRGQGMRVLRFENQQVMENLSGVLDDIRSHFSGAGQELV